MAAATDRSKPFDPNGARRSALVVAPGAVVPGSDAADEPGVTA